MVERMTGGQATVRALAEHGVDVAFGIPGVHTLALYDALIDSPIRHILGRHEQGVGFMADGYARASGKPGVALVITGPGVTNVATSIGEAYADSSPVLVVASAEEQRWAGKMLGHYHDIRDQTEAIRPVTATQAQATAVAEVAPAIDAAFARMAMARPRPTYVEIPRDVLEAEAEIDFPAPVQTGRPAPAAEQIAGTVDEIAAAKRVVIVAGGGALDAGAGIAALAERLGAPVIVSQMGKGVIPEDHPYALGNLWGQDNPIQGIVSKADLALVFGTKLGWAETEGGAMRLPETLIRVDVDPEEIERNYRPSRAIVADAGKTATALAEALAAKGISKQGWSPEEIAKAKDGALATAFGAENGAYIAALRRAIPRDGILVNDTTMMSYAASKHYPVYAPRTFLVPAGYVTLGFSVPAGIGAKIAEPDKVVVAVIGDGGFQFTMHELATARQFRIGLPIVIFNDATYTAVKMDQAMRYDRRYIAVDLENPDFLKLAEAYDIPGVRADSPEALEAAIVEAAGRDLPTIIDTPVGWTY
jgi:acetolactate synthase-1/2/3 large subunit